MEYRTFGATGLNTSVLGIGGSKFGSFLAKGQEHEITAMLHEAMDAGVNFFDTSDIYGQGDSERLLGNALRGRRDKVIIETKAGNCFSAATKTAARFKGPIRAVLRRFPFLKKGVQKARASQLHKNYEPNYLARAVEASLQRLQTDYIDVFMLHSPPPEIIERGDFFALMEDLKRSGKIRYFGISCDTHAEALLSLGKPGVDAIQVPVNAKETRILAEVLPMAVSRNAGVVARSPFSSGLLFDREAGTANRDTGLSVAQSALQSAAAREGVSVVITGTSNRAHLRENLRAFSD